VLGNGKILYAIPVLDGDVPQPVPESQPVAVLRVLKIYKVLPQSRPERSGEQMSFPRLYRIGRLTAGNSGDQQMHQQQRDIVEDAHVDGFDEVQISISRGQATTAFNPAAWFFNPPVIEEEGPMVENDPVFGRIISNLPR